MRIDATLDLGSARPPRVSLGGRPLDLRVHKELALLIFLAVEQEEARNNLRLVLAALAALLQRQYAFDFAFEERAAALQSARRMAEYSGSALREVRVLEDEDTVQSTG